MPVTLNEALGFLYWGSSSATSRENYEIAVPYPTLGSALFETSRMVDSARNARGEMVGRQVGRSIDKQNMAWSKLSCEVWWRMNRWIEAGHFTFYCHYFNFNLGRWETRLFYVSDMKCSPYLIDPASGMPDFVTDASVNVIDCGVI